MSAPPAPAAARRAWLFVTGTMAESFLVYSFVGWFLARGRGADEGSAAPRFALAYGAAALLAAAALALLRRGAAPGTSPERFQRSSLFAMALLELNALLGLVLSIAFRRLEPALSLPAISLGVALFAVFPSGLSYWRRCSGNAPVPPALGPS